jgi:hypothetical protein
MFKPQITITGSTFMDDVWMIILHKQMLAGAFACTALLLIRSAQIIRTGSHFHG